MRSIGIDAVEIERFKHWHRYKPIQLSKFFSEEEIAYCLHTTSKSSERFAVRFAAKEAFYKALSAYSSQTLSFFALVQLVSVTKISNQSSPQLFIDWKKLNDYFSIKQAQAFLSLTHTKTTALAVVVLE